MPTLLADPHEQMDGTVHTWSPGQRALLRFLEREGLLRALPDPPGGAEAPSDELLFATIAPVVEPALLAELMAARLHLPLLESDGAVDPTAAALLAATLAARCRAIPVGLQGETLEVATANPLDLDNVKTLEFATGRRVRVRVATPDTVRRMIAHLYGDEAVLPPEVAPVPAAPAPVEAPRAEAPPAAVPPMAPRLRRVLVVTGDAALRLRLAEGLQAAAADWVVMTARDAEEAKALASLTWPDVALVDTPATAAVLAAGPMAGVPQLLAPDWNDLNDVLDRTRALIDTAHRG